MGFGPYINLAHAATHTFLQPWIWKNESSKMNLAKYSLLSCLNLNVLCHGLKYPRRCVSNLLHIDYLIPVPVVRYIISVNKCITCIYLYKVSIYVCLCVRSELRLLFTVFPQGYVLSLEYIHRDMFSAWNALKKIFFQAKLGSPISAE